MSKALQPSTPDNHLCNLNERESRSLYAVAPLPTGQPPLQLEESFDIQTPFTGCNPTHRATTSATGNTVTVLSLNEARCTPTHRTTTSATWIENQNSVFRSGVAPLPTGQPPLQPTLATRLIHPVSETNVSRKLILAA